MVETLDGVTVVETLAETTVETIFGAVLETIAGISSGR